MVHGNNAKSGSAVSTGNMFAALNKKAARGDPSKVTQSQTQRQQPAAKAGAAVDKGPKKKSRVMTLGNEPEKQEAAPAPEAKETKKEREVKDHHQDRSGKRDRERKGGKGTGGWEESDDVAATAAAAAEPAAAEGWGEDANQGEEAKEGAQAEGEKKEPEEPEKEVVSYAEWKKQQKGPKQGTFNVRQVDAGKLKNLVKVQKGDDSYMTLPKDQPKPEPKPTGKQAKGKGKAAAAPAPKPEPKKKEQKAEKLGADDLGFRMEAFPRGRGGRGGRGGEGRGEGSPRGRGRGRGYGRGRFGGDQGGDAPQNIDIKSADLFPALGAAPAPGAPAPAEGQEE